MNKNDEKIKHISVMNSFPNGIFTASNYKTSLEHRKKYPIKKGGGKMLNIVSPQLLTLVHVKEK
jgi:hypothetical protein